MKDTRTPEDVFLGVPAPEISSRMRDQHPAFRFFWGVVCALAGIGIWMFVSNVNWHNYLNDAPVRTETNPGLYPVQDYEELIQRWEDKIAGKPKRKKVTVGARAGEYADEIPVQPGVRKNLGQYDDALTPYERKQRRMQKDPLPLQDLKKQQSDQSTPWGT